jgi:hypothetical protein
VTRRRYGDGIDAKRTEQYRAYPADRSIIVPEIARLFGKVTKGLLLRVIEDSLRLCPEDRRPVAPTRSQKRMKAGLVAWIDENRPLVMAYLRWSASLRRVRF